MPGNIRRGSELSIDGEFSVSDLVEIRPSRYRNSHSSNNTNGGSLGLGSIGGNGNNNKVGGGGRKKYGTIQRRMSSSTSFRFDIDSERETIALQADNGGNITDLDGGGPNTIGNGDSGMKGLPWYKRFFPTSAKSINYCKLLFLCTMLCIAILGSIFMYIKIQQHNDKLLLDSYNTRSNLIVSSLNDVLTYHIIGITILRNSIVSYTNTANTNANTNNNNWPFVTIPDFNQRITSSRQLLIGSIGFYLIPLISKESRKGKENENDDELIQQQQRQLYEQYTIQNLDWINNNDNYEQEYLIIFDDDNNNNDNNNSSEIYYYNDYNFTTITTNNGNTIFPTFVRRVDQNNNDDYNENNYNTQHNNVLVVTPEEDYDDDNITYFNNDNNNIDYYINSYYYPFWQSSPIQSDLININAISIPFFQQGIIDIMTLSNNNYNELPILLGSTTTPTTTAAATTTTTAVTNDDNNTNNNDEFITSLLLSTSKQINIDNSKNSNTKNTASSYTGIEPVSTMYIPITINNNNDDDNNNNNLVALFLDTIHWQDIFEQAIKKTSSSSNDNNSNNNNDISTSIDNWDVIFVLTNPCSGNTTTTTTNTNTTNTNNANNANDQQEQDQEQEQYTFRFSSSAATSATYLGIGDLHDTKYDSIVKSHIYTFDPNLLIQQQQQQQQHVQLDNMNNTTTTTTNTDCLYTIQVYLSSSSSDTSGTTTTSIIQKNKTKSLIYTLIVAIIFIIILFSFMFYDCIVQTRQRTIMETALEARAIVASLYPKVVRDRLFGDVHRLNTNNHNTNNKNKHYTTNALMQSSYNSNDNSFSTFSENITNNESHPNKNMNKNNNTNTTKPTLMGRLSAARTSIMSTRTLLSSLPSARALQATNSNHSIDANKINNTNRRGFLASIPSGRNLFNDQENTPSTMTDLHNSQISIIKLKGGSEFENGNDDNNSSSSSMSSLGNTNKNDENNNKNSDDIEKGNGNNNNNDNNTNDDDGETHKKNSFLSIGNNSMIFTNNDILPTTSNRSLNNNNLRLRRREDKSFVSREQLKTALSSDEFMNIMEEEDDDNDNNNDDDRHNNSSTSCHRHTTNNDNIYGKSSHLKPIADLFPDTTVMFADIVGFTSWSSQRDPTQVFILLQSLYRAFDKIARKRNVFKVETIGDCYLAVTGLPDPQDDHAWRMVCFALECRCKMFHVTRDLEITLGPDTGDLGMRFGLHSGAVTAGVLRGERSHFQLFGDTVNFASRMESTGICNRIQISEHTANLLIDDGKGDWIRPRKDVVTAKGKGEVKTYWVASRPKQHETPQQEPLEEDEQKQQQQQQYQQPQEQPVVQQQQQIKEDSIKIDDPKHNSHNQNFDGNTSNNAMEEEAVSSEAVNNNHNTTAADNNNNNNKNNNSTTTAQRLALTRSDMSEYSLSESGSDYYPPKSVDAIVLEGRSEELENDEQEQQQQKNRDQQDPSYLERKISLSEQRMRQSAINWQVELLMQALKLIVARRGDPSIINAGYGDEEEVYRAIGNGDNNNSTNNNDDSVITIDPNMIDGSIVLDEFVEAITLPELNQSRGTITAQQRHQEHQPLDPTCITLGLPVISQLSDYVTKIASMYRSTNEFHNFHHACHVTMSASRLLNRIVIPECSLDTELARDLHVATDGINSDPVTQFAILFSALIHDVDHSGVPNEQLIYEEPHMSELYRYQSIAEQKSIDIAWDLLMEDTYADLRYCICGNRLNELTRFRQLVVNCVLATDLFDLKQKEFRERRWNKMVIERKDDEYKTKNTKKDGNLRATLIIEHLMQAADIAHTMQHWLVFRRWNQLLFNERYTAYKTGRVLAIGISDDDNNNNNSKVHNGKSSNNNDNSSTDSSNPATTINTEERSSSIIVNQDPSQTWYETELAFFDEFVIPLANKLQECNLFGDASSSEFLSYAMSNRKEWADYGQNIVAEMVDEYNKNHKTELIPKTSD